MPWVSELIAAVHTRSVAWLVRDGDGGLEAVAASVPGRLEGEAVDEALQGLLERLGILDAVSTSVGTYGAGDDVDQIDTYVFTVQVDSPADFGAPPAGAEVFENAELAELFFQGRLATAATVIATQAVALHMNP